MKQFEDLVFIGFSLMVIYLCGSTIMQINSGIIEEVVKQLVK